MQSIKVLATDSTNLFLRELFREQPSIENCYVVTEEQTKGKGQMGASWVSKKGENLTFSILLNDLNLKIDEQFKLSAIVASSIIEVLKKHNIPKLNIKWPNDILAEQLKICGVLIENILINGRVGSSIIGIGLNVNQQDFEDLAKASSLKKLTGVHFDLEYLLKQLVNTIEKNIYDKKDWAIEAILEEYYKSLFRLEKPSTFEFPTGIRKTGIIKKVSKQGRLIVLFEDNVLNEFDIKEVKLLY
ncbi:BirA family transcriptional regulator, biotin operon repressor / biotin-[acetyl-CoA-carboxylase] ligase [Mesonia phycicola]|uniref:BirA family transcriptional regulator, biotin operon repressor / biotin-[acetyl-CoA-carboxylase] ligase n=1 Tax=Mesonia phycicola TaxID=579105 RepID=A0A1M6ABE3_9FLAO|nr:biotin--[acetyl-CoA-carboxylase] ligase [Mesonia phycicola]SHI33781.1 BirA family transcriptional regulator, biotin operon repressor / biotin-[acetyl-CoA-carboxylase] ligase [Mesonia phycicola]